VVIFQTGIIFQVHFKELFVELEVDHCESLDDLLAIAVSQETVIVAIFNLNNKFVGIGANVDSSDGLTLDLSLDCHSRKDLVEDLCGEAVFRVDVVDSLIGDD